MNARAASALPAPPADRVLDILSVPVTDMTMGEALEFLESLFTTHATTSHSVFFVNAHTLNVACDQPAYRDVLRGAHCVYGDGTGVRWAARLIHGARLRDNVNGTDLVPALFKTRAGRGFRYFLLGNTPERIERAAAFARREFPGWELAGHHHGYLDDTTTPGAVELINASRPHVLLVGMGNPLQEQWIARNLPRLQVPVCMGTGGLFDYWSGDLVRAPRWMRAVGYEWLHLLLRQPHKARRYLIGNPLFLWRALQARFARGQA